MAYPRQACLWELIQKTYVGLGKGRRDLTNPTLFINRSGHIPEHGGGSNRPGYSVKSW